MFIQILGLEALINKIKGATLIKMPANAAIKKATLQFERDVKMATPLDTGRLRSSITHQFLSEMTGLVGTNVGYAPFIEFGHTQTPGRYVPAINRRLVASWVPPRHVLPGSSQRILGEGMFTFTMRNFASKLANIAQGLGRDIAIIWGRK